MYEIEVAEAATVPCALSKASALPSMTLLYNLRSSLQFAIFESFNVACSRTNNIVYIIENTLFTLLKGPSIFVPQGRGLNALNQQK